MSLSNLNRALLLGCLLVIVVLALFLMEWRSAFISITAIPLSLLAAALVLHYRGGTLNTMVLAGLAIALGEVVDDAIIDVENIVRRLRLNRAAAEPRPAFEVVLDASLEVRSAVVYATLIVVLVFLPVFFLDGLAGSFFRPLAMSYVLAVGPRWWSRCRDAGAVPDAAAAGAARDAGRAVPGAAEGPLPRVAARAARSAAARPCRARPSLFAVTLGARRAARRGVHAELQGVRLPDALGREARHLAGSHAAHHGARQPRAAGHPRRAQLRRAHRPGRGGRRGGRAQLHRALDQPRSDGAVRRRPSRRSRQWSTAIPASTATC